MRKIFIILLFFFTKNSFSQWPVSQNLGSDSTIINVGRNFSGGVKGNFINKSYTDTTAANLQRIRQYAGAQIYTTTANKFYIRNSTATQWIEQATVEGLTNITGCYSLLNGGIVTWSGSGLIMDVSPANYVINCIYYSSAQSQVTLSAAHATLPRIDVIAADTTGTVVVLTGTPATDPIKPQVSPESQIELTYVSIPATATTPGGVTQTVVYDENIEWTSSSDLSAGTVDFESTSNPFHLTKNALLSSTASGVLTWTNSSVVSVSSYSSLKLYIRVNSAQTSRYSIAVALSLAGRPISASGSNSLEDYGFNPGVTGSYQVITVPMSVLSAGGTFDGVKLKFKSAGTSFHIDYIQLQSGIPNGNLPYVTNVFRKTATDSVFQVINNVPVFAFKDSTGSTVTASNGLTKTANDIALGGTLTGNTTITNSNAAYTFLIQNTAATSSSNQALVLYGSGTDASSTTLQAEALGVGKAITGISSSGTAIIGTASSGFALYGNIYSTGGTPLAAYTGVSNNNIYPGLRILRNHSSSVGGTGIGSSIQFQHETSTTDTVTANIIESSWTTATHASRESKFLVKGVAAGTTQNIFSFAGTGQLTLDQYTTSNFNGGVAADSVLVVTSAGIVKKRDAASFGGVGGSPAGNYGNVQLNRNGAFATPASDSLDFESATGLTVKGNITSSTLTDGQVLYAGASGLIKSSTKLTFSDGLYPVLGIVGSDPTIYFGSVSTTEPSIGKGSGMAISGGSSTYITSIYSHIGGSQIAKFYRPTDSYNLIELNGLVQSNSTTVLSNYRGNFDVSRTVPYAVSGNNYHGFTDQTDYRQGTQSFNSFSSFVKFGNSTTGFDHYAGFQNVWRKDSSNTVSKIYGFVNAVSEITEGTVTDLYGYYNFNPTVTGGTIGSHYGIYIPTVTGGSTANIGIKLGAGTTTSLPFQMTSGTLLTTALAGGIEFLTDKFYGTITTGAARKEITLNDAALTSGYIPIATTNGRLTDGVQHTQTTYTPTLTNTTNIAASTAYTTYYIQIGDWVHVWGAVDIDATAATTITEMGMSLPVTSGVSQIYEIAGTAAHEDNTSVQIKGDVGNSRAVWRFTPQSASNNKYSFHFSYKIIV